MIFGPYSTGWRDETDRRNKKRRAAWAWVGVALVLSGAALSVYGALAW